MAVTGSWSSSSRGGRLVAAIADKTGHRVWQRSVAAVHELARAASSGEGTLRVFQVDALRLVAPQLATLARRLERMTPSEVAPAIRDAARARPGLFLAVAGATGFVLGRMLMHPTLRTHGGPPKELGGL